MCFTRSCFSGFLCALAGGILSAHAQTTPDYAVQLSAAVQKNPPAISLSWPNDPQAQNYTVYRKTRDSSSWGQGTTLPGTASGYQDGNVTVGSAWEYRVDKSALANGAQFTGEGYIYAGIEAPLVEARGKVLLLVDGTFSSPLTNELTRLQSDLVADGWTVVRHNVSRSDPVSSVKALIKADYAADPARVKAVFLFGHVPVPYSGNAAPDGHPEHVGAWPADAYYADMDGTWSDSTVNASTANDPRNWNIPGDGKFDQSTLPSDLELQVGRVDLSNLPVFSQTETELLRRYLNKDHNFRCKLFQVQAAGAVNDHFGPFNGEAFAANGYRNFAPFFGPGQIQGIGDWSGSLSARTYLWGYGCGPGWYSGASGVTTSSEISTNDPQVVFTMLFGSYFGDWDSQDDLLRSALATPSYTLTSAWVGRPWWQFHHMALGETIGYSTRLSQNNSGTYAGGQRTRGVHIALMGDPTLRLHPVAPPQRLLVTTNTSGQTELHWTASPDSVVGYHVYRAPSADGPFSRLNSNLISGTSFTEPTVSSATYMVRAVKLEQNASGSYYNPSQGILQTFNGTYASLSAPMLGLRALGPAAFCLSGRGLPGATYQIQANDGRPTAAWQTLASVVADSSGAFSFTNTCTSPQRLFRALAQ